ncbi:DUF1501 domain-containing protein [bacterium]|nr:DUF1501 domain-containing protein [bacterium]
MTAAYRAAMLSRRDFLGRAGSGLSGIALSQMLASQGLLGKERPVISPLNPSASREPHHEAKAKRVIVIFCSGAISQLETFDYKPELVKRAGQPLPSMEKGFKSFQGENGNLAAPQFEFRPRGSVGKMTSDLLPKIGELVDDFCFIHSMTSKTNTHGPGENFMSTGFTLDGFPSMGAWATYALGSESDNLPSFVALPDPRGVPQSSVNNWGPGFLPAVFQGTPFNMQKPIGNLSRPIGVSPKTDQAARSYLRYLNERHQEPFAGDTELAARIASYELAARMQLSVPEVTDLSGESASLKKLYGADSANPVKAGFAKNCMLARKLVERGVRFVQLFNGAYAMGEGVGNWDGHRQLKKQYATHGEILDQPVAALIGDLKSRGLFEDTVLAFVTEFGRMPTFQKGASGRDHNPDGFTVFLAGAGIKAPFSYGATDEFGYRASENAVTMHDFHATLLHLVGLDHEELTFYHNGIERRLTDVHGRVLSEILG